MCDGCASSKVNDTAARNPAQSSTVRFRGGPDGRGTPLVPGTGNPEIADRPPAAPALVGLWVSIVLLPCAAQPAATATRIADHRDAGSRVRNVAIGAPSYSPAAIVGSRRIAINARARASARAPG